MGQRGPARKPSGQRHQRRQAAGEVVAAPAERPQMPESFLGRPQAAVWERLCDTLERLSLLSSADWSALERFCDLLIDWREARAGIAAHGRTQVSNGVAIPRPEVKQARDAHRELMQIESRFGLSPSARSGLTAATPAGPAAGGVRSRPRPGR